MKTSRRTGTNQKPIDICICLENLLLNNKNSYLAYCVGDFRRTLIMVRKYVTSNINSFF